MSQKSERHNRLLAHCVKILGRGMYMQALQMQDMESQISYLQAALEPAARKEQEDMKLRKAVASLIREQQRQKRSRQRIFLLLKFTVISMVLIWLSCQIFM